MEKLWDSLRLFIVRLLYPKTSVMIGWDLNTPLACAVSRHSRVFLADCHITSAHCAVETTRQGAVLLGASLESVATRMKNLVGEAQIDLQDPIKGPVDL